MTQQADSATPIAPVSDDVSDALLQDVDFGDETPPSEQQSNEGTGQGAGGDVDGAGGQGASPDGDGDGKGDPPKTYTEAEVEVIRRETQSARDKEFDTLSNRVEGLETVGRGSAIDLAENQAVDDVTQQIMRDNPSATMNEARTQATGLVRNERRKWEGEVQMETERTSLTDLRTTLTTQSRDLASQKLKIEYGLSDEQTADVLKLGDDTSMRLVAGLYKERNAATALTDKTNQDGRTGQDFGGGGPSGDIHPAPELSGDAELDSLMNLDTRDGTLDPKMTKEMEDAGWTP